ncbi:MAG: methyl-accepting chemotaxis protein [Rubrivivax sp.]|nr:methyl-accepting chemotaxis protein [Rubrivivax sp.]
MKFFSNAAVATRLYLGFGLMLVILAAVTLMAMAKVQTIDAELRINSEQNAQIQRHAINFRGSAHDRSIAIRDVVLATTPAARQREQAAIAELADFYARSAGPLEKLIGAPGAEPELAGLYAGIKDIETRAVATTQRIIATLEQGDAAGAQLLLWNQAKPEYVQWLAAVNKLIDFEEARIQTANKVALEEAGSFLSVMLAALVLALVSAGTLAWMISRSVTMQLGAEPQALGDAAKRVAQGDLSPVPGADQAPVGSVLESLGAMQHSLSRLVGAVRGASDSIATGSHEIASGNADLSQRTEVQASHLQQTASAMEQLSQTVQANADTAAQANRMAGSASAEAQKGGAVVGRVVATMDDIAQSSRKIGDIIGTIDGIAFQTNILALNAAVEAARAGEQGRGFAVVASEVRNLAQRSATAAREIKALIGSSVEKVENGTRLVADAGKTMDSIVAQVKDVTDLIGRISGATAEQTQGIGQVGQAVNELDRTTQQNAALVEQSAAAAGSLSEQAQRLADTVRVFKLAAAPAGS